MESPVYRASAFELAERAVQTVKRALQANWGIPVKGTDDKSKHFKGEGKAPIERLLWRRVRLPAFADFDMCEHILFKANEKTTTIPATFFIRMGLNKSVNQTEKATWIMLVRNNQNARLDEDNVKTEPPVEEALSQSKPQVQNTDVGPSHQDESSAAAGQQHQLESAEPWQTSTRSRKQNATVLENLYTQTCIRRIEDVYVLKEP